MGAAWCQFRCPPDASWFTSAKLQSALRQPPVSPRSTAMEQTNYHVCSVCGEISSTPEHWFLALQYPPSDKLIVMKWHRRLASAEGMQSVCCAAHVRELVVHWMAIGRIDHPFARPSSWKGPRRRWTDQTWHWQEVDLQDAVLLNELTVDRESLRRVLSHNPHALRSLLDSLQASLDEEFQHNVAAAQCRSALVV